MDEMNDGKALPNRSLTLQSSLQISQQGAQFIKKAVF